MLRYIIKVTYLDGPHAGKVYFLRKGGQRKTLSTGTTQLTRQRVYASASVIT